MSLPSPRRALAAIAVIAALTIAGSVGSPVRAQQGGVIWQFENVAPLQLAAPGCKFGMTLAGFEYDPQGRPVLAWREENDCGGGPDVFWARRESGAWNLLQFFSERRFDGTGKDGFFHTLILRPSDGNPFLVYRDVVPGNDLYTTRADLGAYPNGGVSTLLEWLVGPQQAASADYSLAFAPDATVPDWVTGLSQANGTGPIRLDGVPIGFGSKPRGALTVTPDGVRHVLWNRDNVLFYARWAPGDPAPTTFPTPIFTNINGAGGEVRLASDEAGVLHAVIRGVEGVSADWDKGAVVYMTSSDSGQSWSPFEYIDPSDAVPNSIGLNANISMALDANRVPAVTYWRADQELWYARRDGPGGTWTRSLVPAGSVQGAPRSAQVRYDADGQPVVALYDMGAGMIRLARQVPFGSVPADLAVTGSVAPDVAQPGALLTYTLTISNRGTTQLDNVELANTLPNGATAVDATPPPASSGYWNLGSLTSGASTTVTVRALAPMAPGTLSDVATVSSGGSDADPGNNIVTILAAVRPTECFVPASGLVDWWRGDGSTLNAISGRAEARGAIAYQPAVVGRGFAFNGSQSLTAEPLGSDASLYPPRGSTTTQAWIKTTAATGVIAARNETVFYMRRLSQQFLYLAAGHLAVSLRDADGATLVFDGTRPVNDGVVHHVALVLDYEAQQARLYVDGAIDASAPFVLGPIGRATGLVIGAYEDFNGVRQVFLTGIIDEFAIHNRVLSAAELAAIVAAPAQPQCGGNNPPTVANPGDQANVEGDTPSVPITAADTDGDTLTFSQAGLPAGLSIDPSTGAIGGTLPAGSAGTYTVTVTVSDGKASASTSFRWTVTIPNRPPTLTNPGPQTNAEADSVTLPLTASDPDGDTLTFSATGLPTGLAIDAATGTITGTLPYTAAGVYSPTVTVTDGRGGSASVTFAWTVTNTNRPPTLTNPGPQSNAEGDSVSLPLSATDPDGDTLTFSATGLPPALSIDAATGQITGTLPYTAAGVYSPTVTVTDGRGGSASVTFAWTVTNTNRPPTLTNPGPQSNAEGDSVSLPLSATDPDGDTLTFSATGLPPALSIDPATGQITGTLPYTAAGVYSPTVTVTDGRGGSASVTFPWTVTNTNRPPTLTNPGPQTNAEGDSINLPLTASDPDGDMLTFSATGLPPGLSIDAATGRITGTTRAGSAASYTPTVSVSDGRASVGQPFTWNVLAPPPPPSGNRAPVCSAAGPSAGVIWPPNHKLVVPVTITGVVDPDGDRLTVTIMRILQDEPTNVTGDGNTPTDGFGVGTSTAQVRAERTGTPKIPGNGRVYEIQFRAVDPSGAACTGAVLTGVPHDQHKPIVDDLIRYDSTVAGGGRVR